MMRTTAEDNPNVALEACKFLPTFSLLNKEACEAGMMTAVVVLLLRLLTQLMRGVF